MKKPKSPPKDTSPKVRNPQKLDFELELNELNWTEKQREFIRIGTDKNTKIVICKSPSGTGKTICSLLCGLKKLQEKKSGKILFLRLPVESASKGIGFLKGEASEKMSPYILPAIDNLSQLLPASQVNRLVSEGYVQCEPIGFIKGRTFNVMTVIVDESEDMTIQECLLAFTRLGRFSTMFVIGDIKQTNVRNSGFAQVFDLFNNEESRERGIYTFEFGKEDIMRNEILSFIIDKFATLDAPPHVARASVDEWRPSQ